MTGAVVEQDRSNSRDARPREIGRFARDQPIRVSRNSGRRFPGSVERCMAPAAAATVVLVLLAALNTGGR